jgi:hypothetical protein
MLASRVAKPLSKTSIIPDPRLTQQPESLARRFPVESSSAKPGLSNPLRSLDSFPVFAPDHVPIGRISSRPHPPASAPRFQHSAKPPAVRSILADSGRPLDSDSLNFFQPAFGRDLSSVRLHSSEQAGASAAALSARAYTVGRHIVLGRGECSSGTATNRRLLAHELTHVIQQSRDGSTSPAETASLEASANSAADRASRGLPVSVTGASKVGIARQSLFDLFSAGKYSWPILQGALTHTRPVATIISDINALTSSERDQAIKDVTAERTTQARKLTDLQAKQDAQSDPALQAVIDPMLPPVQEIISRADQVLDGVLETIAVSETPASLKAETLPPTAAQKTQIASALKPDLRVNSAGNVEPFKDCLDPADDSTCYVNQLRAITPTLIEGHHKQQVDNRGPAEHSDPSKVHALSELERVGNASKRETDNVYGQYKKGPSLKADTKSSRGNIHDLWQDTQDQLKGMTPAQKREMARQLVFYFFQSDSEISAINAAHNADPKFAAGGAPQNDEAKAQKHIVDESTSTPDAVKRLNEIDRGWDASAQAGQVNVQIFKQPDKATGPLAGPNVADRDFLWDMFQTLIHEYIHTLAHPAYNAYADTFGSSSNQFNTLVEGVDSLLDEVVWSAVAPHVNDQALRDDVEGPTYSSLPPIAVQPASRRRYDSYAQAVKLVNVVGIRSLYAAYFLGDVSKIKV